MGGGKQNTNGELIRKRLCADLKSSLIDLEGCSKPTGRKHPSGVQRERLSEKTTKVDAIVQRTSG
jgi:hypothetical protein